MFVTSLSGLAALYLATTSAVTAFPFGNPEKRQDTCSAVHIFLSRGWNEPYPGRQGKLAGAICYGQASCDYEDIQFVTDEATGYCDSVTEGNPSGIAQITAYAARCPDAQLVLSGYSLGANVIGDILGGGGSFFGNNTVNCTIGTTAGLDPTTSPGNKSESIMVGIVVY